MKILNKCYSVVANVEVLEALKEIPKDEKCRELATVSYETLQYLQSSPCNIQTRDTALSYLKALMPYKLHEREKLMMVNDPPRTPTEVQLFVIGHEVRLTEEQLNEIVELTHKHFPNLPPRESKAKTKSKSSKSKKKNS